MKKIIYICDRCRREIKTEGTRIIPHFFDLVTGQMLGEMEVPDDDVHLCMGCTRKLLQEILASGAEDKKGSEKAPAKKEDAGCRKGDDPAPGRVGQQKDGG